MTDKHFYLYLSAITGIIMVAIALVTYYYEGEKAKAYATITNPVTMCFAVAKTTTQQEACTKLLK